MNSYTYIESFFKAILTQSLQIQGRFFVLPRKGEELNTDELEQVMIYANGLKKYPICVMMPPSSTGIFGKQDEWEDYKFTLFFLNTTFYTGNNEVSDKNQFTGTSSKPVTKEWEEMKQAAVDFVRVLQMVQKGQNDQSINMLNNLFRMPNEKKFIDPVSFTSTHYLSGVRLTFNASVFTSCDIEDYVSGGIVVLPPQDESTFEAELIVVRNEVMNIINELGLEGPPGPEGPEGPAGPTGPAGPAGAGAGSFLHTQSSASNVWTITHNLGYKPGGIFVQDSADEQWLGEVTYIDNNNLSISFGPASFGGKAYLS